MTREELVEELNKINGIKLETPIKWGIASIRININDFAIEYYDGDLYFCTKDGCNLMSENRTEQQISEIVKALVG